MDFVAGRPVGLGQIYLEITNRWFLQDLSGSAFLAVTRRRVLLVSPESRETTVLKPDEV